MNHCRSLHRGKRAEIKSRKGASLANCKLSYEVAIAFSSDIKKLSIGSRTSQERDEINPAIDTRETSTARRGAEASSTGLPGYVSGMEPVERH